MANFEKSPRSTFIDTINLGRAQLNQLEALVWQYMPNENATLYKWDMIPEGYNYAACDESHIYCYTSLVEYNKEEKSWCFINKCNDLKCLPLSVLNRLPGEPALSLEKRPGVD